MLSNQTKNKLYIAAAGSGKTTHLVEEALNQKEGKFLITTYTQANESEIRKKIIDENYKKYGLACIPENITVQTWFSFLLKHGVRPFQSSMYEKRVNGLTLVNTDPVRFIPESNIQTHYFDKKSKIYSNKISKFVFRCNEKSNGNVIDRISKIYSHIYIDEVQDLAGYDLELLKLFFNCSSTIQLVGDPRQSTYSTNSAPKNKQFKKSNIVNFFTDQIDNLTKDDTSLMTNYRCNKRICDLSNKLFPSFQATTSGNNVATEHSGVFFIKQQDVESYLQKFQPIQLRDSKRTNVSENYRVMNIGEAKGLSFDRVLIYPTKPFLDWFKNNNAQLAETSRSKLYVAITRARHSIAIICNENLNINGISNYSPQSQV